MPHHPKGHEKSHKKLEKVKGKKLPNLGNKNASMGTDGKMTIISSKMQKNYKPIKQDKYKKLEFEKLITEKNPVNMGHSPLEGHCGPMKMESAKQEKYNLLHDNPVAKHASGSWMSKHSKSALHMGHSPAEMGHESPAKMHGGDHDDDKIKDMKKKTAALNELRRQKGDFGDIPASSSANPKSLSGDDSKEIANMKRKLKALNELRRQKGHFKK